MKKKIFEQFFYLHIAWQTLSTNGWREAHFSCRCWTSISLCRVAVTCTSPRSSRQMMRCTTVWWRWLRYPATPWQPPNRQQKRVWACLSEWLARVSHQMLNGAFYWNWNYAFDIILTDPIPRFMPVFLIKFCLAYFGVFLNLFFFFFFRTFEPISNKLNPLVISFRIRLNWKTSSKRGLLVNNENVYFDLLLKTK